MDHVWEDVSVLEAASWRLASELVRRHPKTLRLLRTHPGSGQYDCLTLLAQDGGEGTIHLNRYGTIQIHNRFDGREPHWEPTGWDQYLRADPRQFLHRLEEASGLPTPSPVPPSTPKTLTLRVLAAIAATGFKSVDPIEIRSGMFDSSLGGGPEEADFQAFAAIPPELRHHQPSDLLHAPEARFWFVHRNQVPVLAFEQDQGLAWTTHGETTLDLTALYSESRRRILVAALKLLRRIDQI